jgi:hypothetical protein
MCIKRLEKRQKHSYVIPIQLQVRETESLNKTGVLKHVKDIILKIRKITDRLAKVNNLSGQNPGTLNNKKKNKCCSCRARI